MSRVAAVAADVEYHKKQPKAKTQAQVIINFSDLTHKLLIDNTDECGNETNSKAEQNEEVAHHPVRQTTNRPK